MPVEGSLWGPGSDVLSPRPCPVVVAISGPGMAAGRHKGLHTKCPSLCVVPAAAALPRHLFRLGEQRKSAASVEVVARGGCSAQPLLSSSQKAAASRKTSRKGPRRAATLKNTCPAAARPAPLRLAPVPASWDGSFPAAGWEIIPLQRAALALPGFRLRGFSSGDSRWQGQSPRSAFWGVPGARGCPPHG